MANRFKPQIGQLPCQLREEVERRLQDGHAYASISAWLAGKGHAGIAIGTISRWFHLHHPKWVRHQMRNQIEAGEKTEGKG